MVETRLSVPRTEHFFKKIVDSALGRLPNL